MIQDLAGSFIIQGLLSFGRHLSSGRGHSAGTLGVAKPRKGNRGPRVETRQKGVSSAEEEGSLRCRGVRRGMEDPGGGQERQEGKRHRMTSRRPRLPEQVLESVG